MTDTKQNSQETLIFAYQKAERIVTAVYVVTDLISFDEPIRRELRSKVLTLLGELLPLKDKLLLSKVHKQIIPTISEILSLLSVSRTARLISEMNVAVLESELIKLTSVLEETHGHAGEVSIGADFFNTDINLTRGGGLLPGAIHRLAPSGPHKGHSDIKDKSDSVHMRRGVNPGGSIGISKRKEKILNVLKGLNRATVGEVAKKIGSYSEKTIQRDLAALVNSGKVVREGERRWTTYGPS